MEGEYPSIQIALMRTGCVGRPLAGNHAFYWGAVGPTHRVAVSGSSLLNVKKEIKFGHY